MRCPRYRTASDWKQPSTLVHLPRDISDEVAAAVLLKGMTAEYLIRRTRRASASAVFDVIASGAVKVEIRHRFPLKNAVDAHRALEDRRTTGPVLMIPAHVSL